MILIVSQESDSERVPVVRRRTRDMKPFEWSLSYDLTVVRGVKTAAAAKSKVIRDAHCVKAIE